MSQTCIYIFITEMADKQKMKLKLIKRNIKGFNIFYYEKERLMLFFLKLCIVSSLFRGHQKVKATYIVLEKETYIFLFLSKKCLRFWWLFFFIKLYARVSISNLKSIIFVLHQHILFQIKYDSTWLNEK